MQGSDCRGFSMIVWVSYPSDWHPSIKLTQPFPRSWRQNSMISPKDWKPERLKRLSNNNSPSYSEFFRSAKTEWGEAERNFCIVAGKQKFRCAHFCTPDIGVCQECKNEVGRSGTEFLHCCGGAKISLCSFLHSGYRSMSGVQKWSGAKRNVIFALLRGSKNFAALIFALRVQTSDFSVVRSAKMKWGEAERNFCIVAGEQKFRCAHFCTPGSDFWFFCRQECKNEVGRSGT